MGNSPSSTTPSPTANDAGSGAKSDMKDLERSDGHSSNYHSYYGNDAPVSGATQSSPFTKDKGLRPYYGMIITVVGVVGVGALVFYFLK